MEEKLIDQKYSDHSAGEEEDPIEEPKRTIKDAEGFKKEITSRPQHFEWSAHAIYASHFVGSHQHPANKAVRPDSQRRSVHAPFGQSSEWREKRD